MSDREFPEPGTSLQQDTQRVWAIRHLFQERGMDRLAAIQTFDTLCTRNPNPRLRRLCETIALQMFPEFARCQADAVPDVEVYAR